MAEILPASSRGHAEVQAEIVAEWSAAVSAALATAAAQQEQARRWIDGGMPEGDVIAPGPADAPSL
jgi:hypothetical protein